MINYEPKDSLAYLASSVLAALDAASENIQDLDGDCPEFNELPEHLQVAIHILDGIRETVRREAMTHNVHRATHYSNGRPVQVNYKGETVHSPEGERWRPDVITTVHPNGTPDAPIPPQLHAV